MAYDGTTNETQGWNLAGGIALAQVLEVGPRGAQVRVAGRSLWASVDSSVDPALLEQAAGDGQRVVLELGQTPCVVGLLMTRRSLELDRSGNLRASLGKLEILAQEAVIKTPKSFLMLKRQVAELCASETVVRGRLLTRLLGKTIRIN